MRGCALVVAALSLRNPGFQLEEHKGLKEPLIPLYYRVRKTIPRSDGPKLPQLLVAELRLESGLSAFGLGVHYHQAIAVLHGFRARRPRMEWGFSGSTSVHLQSKR